MGGGNIAVFLLSGIAFNLLVAFFRRIRSRHFYHCCDPEISNVFTDLQYFLKKPFCEDLEAAIMAVLSFGSFMA